MRFSTSFIAGLALICAITSVASAGTVPLPSYPLAVRSPYLSTWLPGNYANDVATGSPQFWNGQSLLWAVLARIDGKAYYLFGAPGGVRNAEAATQESISYSSTHTIVNLTANSVDFSLDFFSPVSPNNLVRQSLPYSYLTVTATPQSSSHDIQILSAIDDTWTAQNGASVPTLTTGDSGLVYYTFHNQNQEVFTESGDMATWGSVVFGSMQNNLTYQSGSHLDVNQQWIANGILSNTGTTGFSSSDLVALSHNLGSVSKASAVNFAVGHNRDHSIQYLEQSQTAYHQAQYSSIGASLSHFLNDYSGAYDESRTIDSLIVSKGQQVSQNYTDILEASVRQAYGAMEVTINKATLDTSRPYVFLKEISSDGNIQTVDVILPSFPILYLLSPNYLKMLLQPYLDYLSTHQWTQNYLIHDMGKHYPNATGYNGTAYSKVEYMPLEVTASFFTLIAAYEKASGDSTWIKPYVTLLKPFADYLAANGAVPAKQLTTVDALPEAANQTQLAVISAVGLTSFGSFSGMSTYTNEGKEMASFISLPGVGLSSDKTHFTYFYGWDDTWGSLFPLWLDVLLGLQTFSQAAVDMQNAWYKNQLKPTGMPYANGGSTVVDFTVTDWEMFSFAAAGSDLQSALVAEEHSVLTGGYNTVPFPTKYNVIGGNLGKYIQNHARPTVGSNFALLAHQGAWKYE